MCSYERLEYVGDALLSLVVAQHDLTAHPLADEGQLRSVHRLLTVTQCRECACWHPCVASERRFCVLILIELTRRVSIIRSQTVNNKSLHRAAVRLGLHSCILSSPPLADMVGAVTRHGVSDARCLHACHTCCRLEGGTQ